MTATSPTAGPFRGAQRARPFDTKRGDDLTTDDHTCVLLLDDVVLRQVLATRDSDGRSMLIRLNLASAGVPSHTGRLIGRGRHQARATAADRARHPSAGRHAAHDQSSVTDAGPRERSAVHHTAA